MPFALNCIENNVQRALYCALCCRIYVEGEIRFPSPTPTVCFSLGRSDREELSVAQRPRRLARPRTSPFHGGNGGSNPPGDAKNAPARFWPLPRPGSVLLSNLCYSLGKAASFSGLAAAPTRQRLDLAKQKAPAFLPEPEQIELPKLPITVQ